MKKLSLAYIVKNEEENIKKSILSCKDIVDEIIVVDTGSTDNTVKVAEELGAKIEHFDWCDDFATARNYAIEKCSGDFIIFLDADEYFMPSLKKDDRPVFDKYMDNDFDAYGFIQEDIDKKTKKIHHTVHLVRMFKNCEYLRYRNKIHEALSRTDGEELIACVTKDFKIIHTGYSADVSAKKAERNYQMLETIENKKTMEYFYLARESLSLGKPEDTIKYSNLFFEQPDCEQIINNSTMVYEIYFCKLKAMKKLSNKYNHKDIYDWLKIIKTKLSKLPKTYFYLGLYYFDFDFKKSKEYLLEALLKEKEFVESNNLCLDDFENYKADIYYYLAKIEFFNGKRQNAINKAGVACVFDKTNPKYLGLLLTLLNHQRTRGVINKNIEFLSKLYGIQSISIEDLSYLIRSLAKTDLLEEFIYFSIFAVKNFEITSEDNCSDIYFAELISTNNADEVLNKVKDNHTNKGNFIKLCAMIYKAATQIELGDWSVLLNEMPVVYQEVYAMLIDLQIPEKISNEFKTLLKDTFLQMTFLGFADITVEFLETLKIVYGYDTNMSTILNVWSNSGNSDNYTKIIAFMQTIKEEEIYDKDLYAYDFLYFLYVMQDFDSVVEKAWEFMERGYSLSMNYIRGASPSKKNIKKQRELCNAEVIV